MKRFFICVVVLSVFLPALNAQAPQVTKIDPPNWFTGLPSPVLLLYGEGLANLQVKTVTAGVKVERVEGDGSGRHAFVWLDTKDANAGTVKLALTNSQGNASVAATFEILPRRNAQSGTQGLSADDVVVRIFLQRLADPNALRNRIPDLSAGVMHALTGRLDAWRDFGITAVSTTSVNAGTASTGEESSDFYALDGQLGTLRDYQGFVAAAHERGMKVLLDLRFNQIGSSHPWVRDLPQPNWLHGTAGAHLTVDATTALDPIPDPHASAAQRKVVLEGWCDGKFPDLNQQSPRLSQYLIQNALWWIETAGIDGFRLDQFALVDRSFWHDFDQQIHKLYPHFETVAEVSSADPAVTSFFAGGATRFDEIDSGVDVVLDSPLSSTLQDAVFKSAPAAKIAEVLRRDWMYPHPEKLITFFHGDYDGMKAGDNFPAGQGDEAFSMLATLRGIPQLCAEDLDPSANLRKLLQMRKDHIALRRGKLYDIAVDDSVYAYARVFPGSVNGLQSIKPENVLIVVNSSDQPQKRTLHFTDTPLALAQKIMEVIPATSARLANGSVDLELAPKSVAVYAVDCGCEL